MSSKGTFNRESGAAVSLLRHPVDRYLPNIVIRVWDVPENGSSTGSECGFVWSGPDYVVLGIHLNAFDENLVVQVGPHGASRGSDPGYQVTSSDLLADHRIDG